MSTNYDWAALVQTRAAISPTVNTNANFVRWMAAENPPSRWFTRNNPLNCGLNDGSTDGEGSYPNLDIAATETAKVLRQANMAPIWDALDQNAGLEVYSAGCAASGWSTGGYHGHPGFIASIPLPPAVEAPGYVPPIPIPPLPDIKEESVTSSFGPDGRLYVSAASAGTANSAEDNLLVFQLTPTPQGLTINNVIDVTTGIQNIAGGATYRVQA